MKKGQISLFILIGLMVAGVIFLVIFFLQQDVPVLEKNGNPEDVFVRNCYTQATECALYTLASPNNTIPPPSELETEANTYLNTVPEQCFNHFQDFPDSQVMVLALNPNLILNHKSVTTTFNHDISIVTNTKQRTMNPKTIILPLPLLSMREDAVQARASPLLEEIPPSYVDILKGSHDMEIFNTAEGKIVSVLSSEEVRGQPFRFNVGRQ